MYFVHRAFYTEPTRVKFQCHSGESPGHVVMPENKSGALYTAQKQTMRREGLSGLLVNIQHVVRARRKASCASMRPVREVALSERYAYGS